MKHIELEIPDKTAEVLRYVLAQYLSTIDEEQAFTKREIAMHKAILFKLMEQCSN